MLQMRLNEIADLYERVQTLMDDCPEALKLDTDSDNKSVGYVVSLTDDARRLQENLIYAQKYARRLGRTRFSRRA
jgi:hypothetical protein